MYVVHMPSPNANIILRRKVKSQVKLGRMYQSMIIKQLEGEDLAGKITKYCRSVKIQPIVAMRNLRKYMKEVDGKSYRLHFSEEFIELARHYNEQYELLKQLDKNDRRLIISMIIANYYGNR